MSSTKQASGDIGAGGKPPMGTGMYGLRVGGIGPEAGHFLVEAPPSWPRWSVSFKEQVGIAPPLSWDDERAVLPLQPQGFAIVDRGGRHTTLVGVAPDDAALLHPYFGTTALAFATWSGRVALHGGALSTSTGAWGLLGEREAGKSSALAWLVSNGVDVLADDLVVTDAHRVYAGPRLVDLRESAHAHFGLGVDAGVLGTRRRWRASLGAVPAETPFAGLVVLEWGDTVRVDVLSPAERMAALQVHRGLRLPIDNADRTVLQVMARPMLRFTRPRSWPVLDAAMRSLLDVLASYRTPPAVG